MAETWWTFIGGVLASSTLATISVGVLGYVGRNWLTHFYARDLETHKNKLSRELSRDEKQQASVELERAKSELNGLPSERQTRFSLMHQKRAEVIAKIYCLITTA